MPDDYLRRWGELVRWLIDAAPSERKFLEAFFLWIYTPRAHNDGMVDAFIAEVLAFPHKQSNEDLKRYNGDGLGGVRLDLPWANAPHTVLASRFILRPAVGPGACRA